MAASLGCVVAVSVILALMQDKPASNWTFFVSRAGLELKSASRTLIFLPKTYRLGAVSGHRQY